MQREWMQREARTQGDTKRTACKSCGAPVYWVAWEKTGKKMPVDCHPVVDGNVVLVVRKDETGERLIKRLIANVYDGAKDRGRNRYVSHFVTCPNATQHRRAS